MRKTRILETEIMMENQERKNQAFELQDRQTQEQDAPTQQTKALIVIPQPLKKNPLAVDNLVDNFLKYQDFYVINLV